MRTRGASIWKARSSRPMSMPSSNVAVVTVVRYWLSSFIIWLPFSLLYHQTMSTLASCGELSPGALADRAAGGFWCADPRGKARSRRGCSP